MTAKKERKAHDDYIIIITIIIIIIRLFLSQLYILKSRVHSRLPHLR